MFSNCGESYFLHRAIISVVKLNLLVGICMLASFVLSDSSIFSFQNSILFHHHSTLLSLKTRYLVITSAEYFNKVALHVEIKPW